MVTVVNYTTRENLDGEEYIVLVLQGDLEIIKSKESGRFYATARKTTISSTFDETTVAALIGKQLSGDIIKVSCEPYEWVVPETGEVIELEHRYEYVPEGVQSVAPKPKPVHTSERVNPVFFENGAMVD